MNHIIERTCIGCNTKKSKDEFLRIVKNKENEINIDKNGKMSGRGAYICQEVNCLQKAIKSRKLERAFGMKISEEIYEKLRGVIIEK